MSDFEEKLQVQIGGMTCVNCQDKIEKKLKNMNGVLDVSVSYNKGQAEAVYDKRLCSPQKIKNAIREIGYKVLEKNDEQRSVITNVICMLIIIIAIYVILQSMGILNMLAPSQLADRDMGYGMLFVIGLITSVHCIAMCGGINLSQCISNTQKEKLVGDAKTNTGLTTFYPALAYNLGRVCSYTGVGFVLGLAGSLFSSSGTPVSTLLQGVMKILAGIFMVITGINMLGVFPWFRKFTIRMPSFLAHKIGKQKQNARRPFIVGILNGFMPCGPLQSMWIVALAAGNPFAGALSMLLFSLGTVPLMLGFGSLISALGKQFADKAMTIGAVLVTVLGLAILSQGGSLSGWLPPDLLLVLVIASAIAGVLLSLPVKRKLWKNALKLSAILLIIGTYGIWNHHGALVQNDSVADTNIELVDGVQVVHSTLSSGSYPNITVAEGIPVRWEIDAPEGSVNGCNYKMLIRDNDIRYTFHTGENVIEFTPKQSGTIQYSCWMGMIHGNIYVTDK